MWQLYAGIALLLLVALPAAVAAVANVILGPVPGDE